MTTEPRQPPGAVAAAAAAYRRRAEILGRDDYVGAQRRAQGLSDEDLRRQFYVIFDRSIEANEFYEAFPISDTIEDELAALRRQAREGALGDEEHIRRARELLGAAWIAHRRAQGA